MRKLIWIALLAGASFGTQKHLLCVEYQGFSSKELPAVQSLHEIFINKITLMSGNSISFIVPKTGDSLFCSMEADREGKAKYGVSSAVSFKVTSIENGIRIMICQYSLENGSREYVESVDVHLNQSLSYAINTIASNFFKREHMSEYDLRAFATRYGTQSKQKIACFFQIGYFRPPEGRFTSRIYPIHETHGYTSYSIPDSITPVFDTGNASFSIANYSFSLGFKYRFPAYDLSILWKSMGENGQYIMIGYSRVFSLNNTVSGYCGIDMGIGFLEDDRYDNNFKYDEYSDVADRDLNNGPAMLPKIGLSLMNNEKVSFFVESGFLFVIGSEKYNHGGSIDIGLSYTF
ncbi:MAG: hypothetical protein JXA71_07075 [Chitinispirillaceae bacterium]|nr:hypothetical protein [Chitinispirillaceae bacterium]